MSVDLKTMRLIVLIFILAWTAVGQVQPEAERLFRDAAQQAFQRLSNVDVDFDSEGSSVGSSRVFSKHVSISVRKPGRVRISAKLNTGTDTFILSNNSISIYDEGGHGYGTRSGVLRPDAFLITQPFGELSLPVFALTSATITGEETLQIDGAKLLCTIIKVTSNRPAPPGDRTDVVWIDRSSGVPLKRITTNRFSVTTITVTHFATGDAVSPVSFALPSTDGFEINEEILDNFLFTFPANDRDFLFQSSGGSPTSPLTLSGTPALISFGADDCAPFAADRTVFAATSRKLKEMGDRAVRVLAGDPTKVPPVESPDYTTVYSTAEQLDRLGIQIFPSTMVLTPHGTIYRIQQGAMTEEKMLKLVELGKQERVNPDASSYVGSTPGVVTPVPTYKVLPTLTSEAKALKLSGPVVIAVFVGKDGTVKRATVTHSLHPILDALAAEAVQRWIFKPGELDGQPVNVTINVTVEFARPSGK